MVIAEFPSHYPARRVVFSPLCPPATMPPSSAISIPGSIRAAFRSSPKIVTQRCAVHGNYLIYATAHRDIQSF